MPVRMGGRKEKDQEGKEELDESADPAHGSGSEQEKQSPDLPSSDRAANGEDEALASSGTEQIGAFEQTSPSAKPQPSTHFEQIDVRDAGPTTPSPSLQHQRAQPRRGEPARPARGKGERWEETYKQRYGPNLSQSESKVYDRRNYGGGPPRPRTAYEEQAYRAGYVKAKTPEEARLYQLNERRYAADLEPRGDERGFSHRGQMLERNPVHEGSRMTRDRGSPGGRALPEQREDPRAWYADRPAPFRDDPRGRLPPRQPVDFDDPYNEAPQWYGPGRVRDEAPRQAAHREPPRSEAEYLYMYPWGQRQHGRPEDPRDPRILRDPRMAHERTPSPPRLEGRSGGAYPPGPPQAYGPPAPYDAGPRGPGSHMYWSPPRATPAQPGHGPDRGPWEAPQAQTSIPLPPGFERSLWFTDPTFNFVFRELREKNGHLSACISSLCAKARHNSEPVVSEIIKLYDAKAKRRKKKAGLLEYMAEVHANWGSPEPLFTIQSYDLVFESFGV